MLELHPYLKRVYEDDIVDCMMCHTIAIKVRRHFIRFNSIALSFTIASSCKIGKVTHKARRPTWPELIPVSLA